MLERPNFPDERIAGCLRDSYGVPVAAVDFLPVGNDSNAWVYRVTAEDGSDYFLKVRRGAAGGPSFVVPRSLKDAGIAEVVAPLSTRGQGLWARVDEFTLALYPFIDGEMAAKTGLSDRQWSEFGGVLRRIHAVALSSEPLRGLRRETFSEPKIELVRAIHARIARTDDNEPYRKELASFWRQKGDEIVRIADRAEELGRELKGRALEFVLCHADIHTFNVLIDRDGHMFVIDWDETLLAPRERDLMFVLDGGGIGGGLVEDRALKAFRQGYGTMKIDGMVMAFYRYQWAVQEIGDYAERVFMREDLGEETKRDAVHSFAGLFQPGDVVEAAYRSLPPP